MITRVVLAKLSPTMEEGTIVKWSKNEGDTIKVGDVMAEIETDKANMEMEALGAGVLRKILVPAGGKAPVGALIGVIADPNEDISATLAKAGPAAAPAAAPTPAATTPAPAAPAAAPPAAGAPGATDRGPTLAPASPEASAPAAPAPAAPAPAAPAPAAPAPAAAAPAPGPVGVPTPNGGRVKASPLARSMATSRGIPLASVPGSGPGGRIIKRDIESWTGGGAAATPAPSVTPGQEIPLSNMRKAIAKRTVDSMSSAPHFYVTVEIDMDKAVALREQITAADVKVSYNDFIVKACALALARQPLVNASWGGDKIVTHGDVHVGVAMALPDGLLIPVVRNADRKGLGAIAAEIRDLAARARDKKIKPEEYTGSTFSVSNLGMYDVTEFTAIINPPDSAILAVGAVRKQPVVVGDEIRVGQRMKVTLSADHRVIDGALAAQFLAEVRRLLENPVLILV